MLLRAFGAFHTEVIRKNSDLVSFCEKYFLRHKSMEEVFKLYQQLIRIMGTISKESLSLVECLTPPTSKQEATLRQIILSGYPDNVARLDESGGPSFGKNSVPVYKTIWSNESEYFIIHLGSALYRTRPAPKWIVFDQVQAREQILGVDNEKLSLRNSDGPERKYLKTVTVVSENWFLDQCNAMVNKGRVIEQPEPKYNPKLDSVMGYIAPSYGPKAWELDLSEIAVDSETAVPFFARALLEGIVKFSEREQDNLFAALSVHHYLYRGI
jgi:hypothetical protein